MILINCCPYPLALIHIHQLFLQFCRFLTNPLLRISLFPNIHSLQLHKLGKNYLFSFLPPTSCLARPVLPVKQMKYARGLQLVGALGFQCSLSLLIQSIYLSLFPCLFSSASRKSGSAFIAFFIYVYHTSIARKIAIGNLQFFLARSFLGSRDCLEPPGCLYIFLESSSLN